MTVQAGRGRRSPGRVLKSPLAAPGAAPVPSPDALGSLTCALGRAALTDREATLAEFQGYLRTVNNRDGQPFEEKTITAWGRPVWRSPRCAAPFGDRREAGPSRRHPTGRTPRERLLRTPWGR